jgi:hypothetical protein
MDGAGGAQPTLPGRAARALAALWTRDWVRGPLLLIYYLALIYLLARVYGTGPQPTPPPFVYQGF